jgi:hypothetical protein
MRLAAILVPMLHAASGHLGSMLHAASGWRPSWFRCYMRPAADCRLVPFARDWLANGWKITIGLAARRMQVFHTTGCLRVTDCLRHAANLENFECCGRQYTAKPPVFYKHAASTVMDNNSMSKASEKNMINFAADIPMYL